MKESDDLLLPWEIHPALTEPRLTKVGQLAWGARKSAAGDAKWEEGDYLWDIGCKAYVRTRHAIATAAKGELREWLSLTTTNPYQGRFVFKIGGVPIRFYRGDPNETAPEKYAYASPLELLTLQTAFQVTDTPTPEAYFRLVVKTDRKGFPLVLSLVQVNDQGETQNPWRIPVDSAKPIRDIAETREEAVELPPPPVGDEVDARDADSDEDEDVGEKTGGA